MFQSDLIEQDSQWVPWGVDGNALATLSDAESEELADPQTILDIALDLLERDHPKQADDLLTSALLVYPKDEQLWLAAGVCRLRRGVHRSAVAAFEMSAWLSGDPDTKSFAEISKDAFDTFQ